MKQYKSRAALKDLAKKKLDGRFSNALFALLLVDIVTRAASNLIISLIPGRSAFSYVLSFLFSLVISTFLGILQTGIAYYFLKLSCNKRAAHSDIFYGFHVYPEKSIKISLVHVLAESLCLLPYQIFLLRFLSTQNMNDMLISLIAMVIGYIILTPIKLMISQTYYLLLDFPEASVAEIFRTGIRIMKGHKWRLFLLDLSFLPLYVLGFLSFGIGLLWLNPYMRTTYTLFFLDLRQDNWNLSKTSSPADAAVIISEV